MNRNPLPLALTLSLALSACSASTDDLTEVLPDDRVLVNLDTSGADAFTARSDVGDWSEYYLQTAESTETVNGFIGAVLDLLDTLVHLEPSDIDRRHHTATWGPYSDTLDPVQTRLTVQYDPETDTHTWWFDQWPKGEDGSDPVVVVAGEVDPGATRTDSTGRFAVDFAALASLDPTTDVSGLFVSEYDLAPDGVAASAAFQDWVDLDHPEEPINAGYVYAQGDDGAGSMDLAWQDDYLDDGSLDVYVLRSRWDGSGAGRGDAVLAEGGEELLGAASECWDDAFKLVYRATSWEGELGDAADCVYTDAAWPE